ncbi:MAG: hypothetical protein PHO93_03800, partial [Candidatus Saccharimonadaceae bacterium]|nr:hypothetical protein [Candidatus Saccharimonadaceae bacterium]
VPIYLTSTGPKLDFRHSGNTNFVLSDGHVDSGKFNIFLVADAYYGTQTMTGARIVKYIMNPNFR